MLSGTRPVVRSAVFAAVVLLFGSILFVFDDVPALHPEAVREWLSRTGAWAPFAYMAAMALVVVTPLPSLPLNVAAGVYFGPVPGTIYSVAGATAGAAASFLLARFLGREIIERILRGHINFCSACSDRLLTKVVFLARLVPVVSFDLVSYGAGLTALSLRRFILANVLGMLPLTFVYNYFGRAVAIGRGWSAALSATFVALFFLLPRWIERYDLFSYPGKVHSAGPKKSEPDEQR